MTKRQMLGSGTSDELGDACVLYNQSMCMAAHQPCGCLRPAPVFEGLAASKRPTCVGSATARAEQWNLRCCAQPEDRVVRDPTLSAI